MKSIIKIMHAPTLVAVIMYVSSLSAAAQCTHDFTLTKTSPTGAICSSQPVVFRAEYIPPPTGYVQGEFRWYLNGGATPLYTQAVGTDLNWYSDYGFWAQEGTTTVYVSFYDYSAQCESYRNSYEFSITTASNFVQQYARECGDGIGHILFTNGSNGVRFTIYKWNGSSYDYIGASSTGYYDLTDFYGNDADKYYVVAQSASGCTLSGYVQVQFDIQQNSAPTISGTTSYCEGVSTTLTASGGNGTFKWYDGSGVAINSSVQLTVPSTLPPSAYNYSVERISPQGCITNRAYTTVDVLPRPVNGTISASATTVCLGDAVTISGSGGVGELHFWGSTNGGATWDIFSDQHVGESSFTFTPAATGLYRFRLRNKTACGFCFDAGNVCTTDPYIDIHVTQSVGGTTQSAVTGQALNIVFDNHIDPTSLIGQVGNVQGWEYTYEAAGVGLYYPWGQSGQTTTSVTCCINPGSTIWIRAQVKNGSCPAVPSESTSYYWKLVMPTVDAGSDTFIDTRYQSVSLAGEAVSPSGTITNYLWTQVSGNAVTLTDATTRSVVVSGFAVGDYVFRLMVTDDKGQTASDEVKLIVSTANDQNYIKEYTPLVSGATVEQVPGLAPNELTLLTSYLDGLGRLVQSVSWQASPLFKDLIQLRSYDELGRESNKYVPYTSTESAGFYGADALRSPSTNSADETTRYRSGKQYAFYQGGLNMANDQYPFSKSVYEPSPLERVSKQGSPGADWQPDGGRVVTNKFLINDESEVYHFSYDLTTGLVTLPTGPERWYPEGKLQVLSIIDEDQNQVIEYVDKDGHTVCKKVKAPNNTYAFTYYIYDDFGNLVVVIPPEGVKQMAN